MNPAFVKAILKFCTTKKLFSSQSVRMFIISQHVLDSVITGALPIAFIIFFFKFIFCLKVPFLIFRNRSKTQTLFYSSCLGNKGYSSEWCGFAARLD